jgi:regulator of cell morphogenesis and NO signaling
MIVKTTKMAEVINMNHHLLSVIHKAGITLGFGDAAIDEVAAKHELNPDFVVAILNAYNDPSYLPEQHLMAFSVVEIVSYLRRSHKAYIFEQLPELANLFEKYATETVSSPYSGLLRNFFDEYRNEMEKHFATEDEYMFPYALAVESAHNGAEISEEMALHFREYTIRDFQQEHDNIEEKLDDLKNLIVRHVPQAEDSVLAFHILEKLFHLDSDLDDHSRIEEQVLIPKVVRLETELKRTIQ